MTVLGLGILNTEEIHCMAKLGFLQSRSEPHTIHMQSTACFLCTITIHIGVPEVYSLCSSCECCCCNAWLNLLQPLIYLIVDALLKLLSFGIPNGATHCFSKVDLSDSSLKDKSVTYSLNRQSRLYLP